MRLKFIFCFLMFCFSITFAQESSRLFQLISSDLLVQQPEIDRKFQTFLSEEMNKEFSGLKIKFVRENVNALKIDLLNIINPIEIPDSQTLLLKSDSICAKWASLIEAGLKKTLGFSAETQEFIAGVLNVYLAETLTDKFPKTELKNNPDIVKTAASLFAEYFYSDIFKIHKVTENLILALKTAKENFRIYAVELFDKVNTVLNDRIEKPLGEKVKGTLGAKVEGKDQVFNGGLLFNLQETDSWKLAIFVNTDINVPESANNVRSLFGGKAVVVCRNLQIDLLAATYFGAEEFHKINGWEFGCGINYKAGKESVIGLAGFVQKNKEISADVFFSAGVMYKFSPGFPALIFGVADNTEKKSRLFFQINQPIFLN